MQSYVCKEMGKDIIYLSSMHLTERVIASYHVLGTHDRLVNLDLKDRPQAQIELHDELKYNTGMYIHRAMKKVKGNGCILATSLGKSKGYLRYWDQYFSYLKILNPYCLNNGAAGASWATGLYS